MSEGIGREREVAMLTVHDIVAGVDLADVGSPYGTEMVRKYATEGNLLALCYMKSSDGRKPTHQPKDRPQ